MIPETRAREAERRPRGERAVGVLLVAGGALLAAAAFAAGSPAVGAVGVLACAAAFLPPRARAAFAGVAGAALLALEVPGLAARTGAALRIALLHLGLVVGAAALLRVAWRPSRAASRSAAAALGAVLLYVLLPSGAGLLVAPGRLGIGDFAFRALVSFEWLLLPVAGLGVYAGLRDRRGDAAALATLLVLWYPAYLAIDLSFQIGSLHDLRANLDAVRGVAAALVARAWLCAGAASLRARHNAS